jgi:hypothetical protein
MHNLGVNIGKYAPSWEQEASADVIWGEQIGKASEEKEKMRKTKGERGQMKAKMNEKG